MKPLHRAVGAKNWLAEPEHRGVFPDWSGVRRYREPFFFGGSVFYRIVAESEAGRRGRVPVVLGDANPFVCDLLVALRDHPWELLGAMADRPSEDRTFFAARERLNLWLKREHSADPAALVPRAADFLAMMVMGFNGLWRVNQKGEINVPIGRTAKGGLAKMPGRDRVMEAHRALVACKAEVRHGDFADQLADVGEGEWSYLDCPYVDSFTGYTAARFSAGDPTDQGQIFPKEVPRKKSDLERLRDACDEIQRRGGHFLASNLDTNRVREVFAGYRIDRVEVRHSVSCDADTRGAVGEVLIRNY